VKSANKEIASSSATTIILGDLNVSQTFRLTINKQVKLSVAQFSRFQNLSNQYLASIHQSSAFKGELGPAPEISLR